MPVLLEIHSSLVSTIASRSSFDNTVEGIELPTPESRQAVNALLARAQVVRCLRAGLPRARWKARGSSHRAPLQRIGDDEDLKGAALLFASDAGKHITGQILAVDGGVSSVH